MKTRQIGKSQNTINEPSKRPLIESEPSQFALDVAGQYTNLLKRAKSLARRYRYGDRDELAVDLVQATILRALSKENKFTPGTNLGAWLGTILFNTFKTHVRKCKFSGAMPLAPPFAGGDDGDRYYTFINNLEDKHNLSADTAVRNKEIASATAAAIMEIPEDHRWPLLLMLEEDMGTKEIAKLFGIPQGTVMSRVFRTKNKLRDGLRKSLNIDGDSKADGKEN